jgi:uncharacterized protein YndB with AHSA1/START domain
MQMPGFVLTTRAQAPVEEVWKLLHDPARFPQWWAGVETVRPQGSDQFTLWPVGYPDFPMAQRLRTERADGRVTISCLVSDLEFRWQLSEAGAATDIEVQVSIPEAEAHRLEAQRDLLTESISRLAALAVRGSSGPGP